MGEFSECECVEWLQLAIDRDCSVYKAIHYSFFWSSDIDKISRAYEFFCYIYKLDGGRDRETHKL